MKKHEIALLLFAAFILYPAPGVCLSDCTKNSDACSAGTGAQSPFLAASMAGNTTVQAAPVPERKQRGAAARHAAAPPAAAVSTTPVRSPEGLVAEPGGRLSSPAWLLLVIAGFAGLYTYLRDGIKKRRRK